jgi:hypothetical protein
VETSIGLTVGRDAKIGFLVNTRHDPATVTLVIGRSLAEITFDPAMLETLRDKADEAVRRLGKAGGAGLGT